MGRRAARFPGPGSKIHPGVGTPDHIELRTVQQSRLLTSKSIGRQAYRVQEEWDVSNGTWPRFRSDSSGGNVRPRACRWGLGPRLSSPSWNGRATGQAQVERRKGTRHECIPRAEIVRDRASVPLELVKSQGLVIAGRMYMRLTVRKHRTILFEYCVEPSAGSNVELGACSNVPQYTND